MTRDIFNSSLRRENSIILVEKLGEPCLQNEPVIVLANGNLQGLLKVEISLNKLRAD